MGDSSLNDTADVGGGVKKGWSTKDVVISVLTLVVIIFLCLAAIYFKDYLLDTEYIAHYGLLGVLITAFVAGSTVSVLAIPVPYWLLVFTLPSILAPEWGIGAPITVGIISGFGACLGQTLTFIIGWGGRDLSEKLASKLSKGLYTKAMYWAQRHGSLAVFTMSAVLNPFHLPMTLAMASLGFSGWKFVLFSLLGNIVKGVFIAFCGYFGLTSLFRLLGV